MTEGFEVALTVNGTHRTARVPARRLLSDLLRHDLGLTGTHVGCEHGVCGCCTVLLDGDPVRSCLMLAVTAAGHEVTTVEGLAAPDGTPSPVQRAFRECHGLQCGFCTPGFLCTVTALLRETPRPTEDQVLEGISGNLCRCTGYQNIVKSVHRAADLLSGSGGCGGSSPRKELSGSGGCGGSSPRKELSGPGGCGGPSPRKELSECGGSSPGEETVEES